MCIVCFDMFVFLGKLFYENNFGVILTVENSSSLIPQYTNTVFPNSELQTWGLITCYALPIILFTSKSTFLILYVKLTFKIIDSEFKFHSKQYNVNITLSQWNTKYISKI